MVARIEAGRRSGCICRSAVRGRLASRSAALLVRHVNACGKPLNSSELRWMTRSTAESYRIVNQCPDTNDDLNFSLKLEI